MLCTELIMKRVVLIVVEVLKLVSWCFEPSQPQRIMSGLKTKFNPSPSYRDDDDNDDDDDDDTRISSQLSKN